MRLIPTPFLPYFIIGVVNAMERLFSVSRKLIYTEKQRKYVAYNVSLAKKIKEHKGYSGDIRFIHGLIVSHFMEDVLYEPLKDLYLDKIKKIVYKDYSFVCRPVHVDEKFIKYKIMAYYIIKKMYERTKHTLMKKNKNITYRELNSKGVTRVDINHKFKEIIMYKGDNVDKVLNFYVKLSNHKSS